MTSSHLAHISDRGQTQTVLEHLRGTASLAQTFARPFGGEGQAELTGLAHDIGKYSQRFQRRLQGDSARVDHSTAGAVECWRRNQPFAAFAVAGHHGGLPDGGSQTDNSDQATLLGRMNRAGSLEPYGDWEQELSLPQAAWPDFLRRGPGPEMVFLRGCSTPAWWTLIFWTPRHLWWGRAGREMRLPSRSCGTGCSAKYPIGFRRGGS